MGCCLKRRTTCRNWYEIVDTGLISRQDFQTSENASMVVWSKTRPSQFAEKHRRFDSHRGSKQGTHADTTRATAPPQVGETLVRTDKTGQSAASGHHLCTHTLALCRSKQHWTTQEGRNDQTHQAMVVCHGQRQVDFECALWLRYWHWQRASGQWKWAQTRSCWVCSK